MEIYGCSDQAPEYPMLGPSTGFFGKRTSAIVEARTYGSYKYKFEITLQNIKASKPLR